jgi:hypothetical protein
MAKRVISLPEHVDPERIAWRMNQEIEHLRLLSIFHYIVASLAVFFSFFPLLYAGMGTLILYAAHHPGPSNQNPAPPMLGWFFIASGVLFFLAGLAMAICILLVGRSLSRRCHYWGVYCPTFRFFIPWAARARPDSASENGKKFRCRPILLCQPSV